MSFEFQPIKYGWTALAAIAITGATIFVPHNERRTVRQVDKIEVLLAIHERCLATSNGIYDRVAPLEIVRDWVTNCIVTNGTTNLAFYTNRYTNAFGLYVEPNVSKHEYGTYYDSHTHWGDVVGKVMELIPRFVNTNYDYTTNLPVMLTVTGLFAELGIGNGTNQFTIRPATTNIQTNYVVAYTQDVSFWGYTEAQPGGGQYHVTAGDYYVLRTNYAFTEYVSNIVHVYTSTTPQIVNFAVAHDTVPYTNSLPQVYAVAETNVFGVTVPSGTYYVVYDTYAADPRAAYRFDGQGYKYFLNYSMIGAEPLLYDLYGAHYLANFQYTNIAFSQAKVMTLTNSALYGTPDYSSMTFLEELYRVLHALRVTAGKTPGLAYRYRRVVDSATIYLPPGETFSFESALGQTKTSFVSAEDTAITNSGSFTVFSYAVWDGPYYDYGVYSNFWLYYADIRGGEIDGLVAANFNQDLPHRSFAPQAVDVFLSSRIGYAPWPPVASSFGSAFETGVYYSAAEADYSTKSNLALPIGEARFIENVGWGALTNDGHYTQALGLQFRLRPDGLGKIVTEWQFQYCTNKYW